MRILIVEDEELLAERIKDVLEKEKYLPEVEYDGENGLSRILGENYDLILLDILLPKLNGLSLLKEVRSQGIKTPVLLLTAKNQTEDKVKGLDYGADDYLTKPFSIAELLARIRSLLRRTSIEKSTLLACADLHLDSVTHEVKRENKNIELTNKEFSILEFLLYNKNRVVSRLSIAEHVWGDNFDLFTMTNFVDVHIKNLRKKIEIEGKEEIIKTMRGVGYIIKDC